MTRNPLLLLIVLLGLAAPAASETFYKWVDDQGVTQYTTTPPPQGSRSVGDVNVDLREPTAPAPGIPAYTATPAEKPVVIYTAEWCGVCKTAKRYFREKDVRYTEYDIEKSSKGRSDYKKLNGKGVPIILVGNERMNGFSPGSFEKLRKQ